MFIFKKKMGSSRILLVLSLLFLFIIPLISAEDVNKILSSSELYLIFILFGYGLIILGYVLKSEVVTMFGSMLLLGEILFLFTNGLGAFATYSTQTFIFAMINLAVGLFFLSKSALEMMNLLDWK